MQSYAVPPNDIISVTLGIAAEKNWIMSIHLSVPARVNILGNPTDGNEGAFATISAAVDLRARAVIDSHENHILEPTLADIPPIAFNPSELPLPYQDSGDLLKAAINRLFACRWNPS